MSIRNDILLKIRAALGGAPLGVDDMSNRNKILSDTVQVAGGTVRNESNLNMLLEDLYNALSADSGTITITGTGFGVGPSEFFFDTVDNNGDVYDSVADGTLVPVRADGAVDAPFNNRGSAMTLESTDTYGNRSRVYGSIDDAHLDRPLLAESSSQERDKLFIKFKMKTNWNVFDGAADKFFRVWSDLPGLALRVEVENSGLVIDNRTLATLKTAYHPSYAPANMWFDIEVYVDIPNNTVRTKYFNMDSMHITDSTVSFDSQALPHGLMASLFGFDDGNDGSAGKIFRYSDYYLATSDSHVVLHSAPEWSRSLHTEVQLPTSWTDTAVTFDTDGQVIDAANCWASVVINNEAVETIQIGSPVAIEQDIRRLVVNSDAGAFTLSETIIADSSVMTFKAKFLIETDACTVFSFAKSGYNSRINYDTVNKTWALRSGYGTTTDGLASAHAGLDDGIEHTIRVEFVSATECNIFIDDVLDADTTTGNFGTFNVFLFGSMENAAGNAYLWDVEWIDGVTNRHWPLANGSTTDTENPTIDIVAEGLTAPWGYLPNEGY